VNIGKLRHRIRHQRLVSTTDAYGAPVKDWQTVNTYWGQISPNKGREPHEDAQPHDETKVTITMRYRDTITARDRLVHGGRIYNIVDIRVPNYPNMLIIDATAGLSNG